MRTILATETFTTVGTDDKIIGVFIDSTSATFSARYLGNSGGDQSDRSATGVYAATDGAAVLGLCGYVPGPFDTIYVATGSAPVRALTKGDL